MKCENYFCAYYLEQECRLSVISLDIKGCCNDCVLIEATENLEAQRGELFQHLDNLFEDE